MTQKNEPENKMNEVNVLLNLANIRYLPRYIIIAIDVFLIGVSTFFSFKILEKVLNHSDFIAESFAGYALIIAVSLFYMYVFKTYAGIIRHSTFYDLLNLLWCIVATTFTLWALSGVYNMVYDHSVPENISFFIVFFFFSFSTLFMFRLFVKEMFRWIKEYKDNSLKKRILILGISDYSVAIANSIIESHNLQYKLKGFLTKRNDSRNAKIFGLDIMTQDTFIKTPKEELEIDGILILKENLSANELTEWVNLFLEKEMEIFQAPLVEEFNPEKIHTNIRSFQIEDLLNREPICIENEEVRLIHENKSVLVTGGAGSIGSEIVRKVASYKPSKVVVVDQAETPLHEIQLEMNEKFPDIDFEFILADITNKKRLESIFTKFNFDLVYHAAAYKHVPMIENNPHEAVWVNILGTQNLAKLSVLYNIKTFVMVSTDKAVNPTNVMGASKRSAELLVQSLQFLPENKTKFITTRFGNVLGSNGSVIPLFKKQIEAGGPITITHPDIVRYFMTISEACELVLQASTMGKGGEIFVFDMGKPVKIKDLAIKMIKLSGKEPEKDILLKYTGLRPGEKLYEELLSDNTKNLPTPHHKIMVSMDPHKEYNEIKDLLEQIENATLSHDNNQIVRILKNMVPEFISNNSIFEKLDR
ncbi:polysaccharide biosynthesis protein [Cloacibacterium normanense]|uniref:Polysaccharide biosynthesis protein n=1 Tax=Cloacibacterium normanense TaxID=237258 RepID=A0A2S7I1U3_9FLAO|nr:nucleoside-diphosphate sugar epimerase/dehydratase [Cloacibacterium normanense]PPZ90552.1 polysaccharide biosynthesis protein [Cloacibacterium normanense]